MARSLGKIEAQDSSPLDVPGRPLSGVTADTSKSWDAQIEPDVTDTPDADLAMPEGLRRLGMPPLAPTRGLSRKPSREKRREPRLPARPQADGPIPPLIPPLVPPQGAEPVAAPDPVRAPEDILAPTAPPQPTPQPTEQPVAAPKPSAVPTVVPTAAPPEPAAEAKPKRLPPRLRKKLEEDAKAKGDSAATAAPNTQEAPAATAERSAPKVSPPSRSRGPIRRLAGGRWWRRSIRGRSGAPAGDSTA